MTTTFYAQPHPPEKPRLPERWPALAASSYEARFHQKSGLRRDRVLSRGHARCNGSGRVAAAITLDLLREAPQPAIEPTLTDAIRQA